MRTEIPRDTASRILVDSDRTCCVCQISGKPIQIHHLNEDPSNHDPANLAVLCFDCHDQTQLRGGFGRKLEASQIILYREEWVSRVRKRRELADETVVRALASSPTIVRSRESASTAYPRPYAPLGPYVAALPSIRRAAYAAAQPLWDGTTADMMNGSYAVIDVLRQILTDLAAWYPADHFGPGDVSDYVNAFTASLFKWHRSHLEIDGHGKTGTMVGPMAAGDVMGDLERMVEEMVGSLADRTEIDFQEWRARWRQEP